MKLIYDIETEMALVDIEERDLDEQWIMISHMDGYGATDICIGEHMMTWKQLDKLNQGIEVAEKNWRK